MGKVILAMVTLDQKKIMEGGVPTFQATDKEDQEKIALELVLALKGSIYELSNGVIIITEK